MSNQNLSDEVTHATKLDAVHRGELAELAFKSVLGKSPSRDHYRVQTANSRSQTYSAKDIDFLVAYIFAEDIW